MPAALGCFFQKQFQTAEENRHQNNAGIVDAAELAPIGLLMGTAERNSGGYKNSRDDVDEKYPVP